MKFNVNGASVSISLLESVTKIIFSEQNLHFKNFLSENTFTQCFSYQNISKSITFSYIQKI